MSRQVSFAAVCADTRLGFHVRVVGSCPSLGDWIPSNGLPLATSANDFPTWKSSGPVPIPQDETIEYKYVICTNGGAPVRWEERPNRNFHLGELLARGIFPKDGAISIVEGFNISNDSDGDRFRSETMANFRRTFSGREPGAETSFGRRPSVVSRISGGSGSFEAEGGAAAGAPDDLFAPTIRERMPSMSCLSGNDSYNSLAMRSASLSVFGGLAGQDPEPAPEVTGMPGGRQTSVGSQGGDHRGGLPQSGSDGGIGHLAREESCSNLFLDTTIGEEEEDHKDSSQFENKYALVGNGPLGEGTFGLVWRCKPKSPDAADRADDKARAAKIVRKARLQPRDMRYLLGEDGEVRTHLTMNHPHIVRLYEYFDEATTVTLVLEYCAGGDLFDAIVKQSRVSGRGFKEAETAHVASHVLSALAYVHQNQVVHRDIKCENILLQALDVPVEQNVFKLCDFGFAAHDRGDGLSDRLGSPDTVAPEVVVGTRYSTPADLWSAGVLIYMMLSATPPFYATTDGEVLRKVRTGSYSLSGDLWDSVSHPPKDMISKLMTVDSKTRPTAAQALRSEWLKDIPLAVPLP